MEYWPLHSLLVHCVEGIHGILHVCAFDWHVLTAVLTRWVEWSVIHRYSALTTTLVHPLWLAMYVHGLENNIIWLYSWTTVTRSMALRILIILDMQCWHYSRILQVKGMYTVHGAACVPNIFQVDLSPLFFNANGVIFGAAILCNDDDHSEFIDLQLLPCSSQRTVCCCKSINSLKHCVCDIKLLLIYWMHMLA